MLGFVIISKKKLKDIESDAYYRGFQVARSVGYSDPTPPSYGRVEYRGPYAASSCSVTSDNTQAANRAVQVMRATLNEKPKQSRRRLASYQDKNLRLIEDGAALEAYIFNCIGKMSNYAIARLICKKMGTHVRGKMHPMKIDQPFVGRVINRQMNWDARLGYFIRQRKD